MKKLIITLLTIFIVLTGYSQVERTQYIGLPNNIVEVRNKLRIDALKDATGDSIMVTDEKGNVILRAISSLGITPSSGVAGITPGTNILVDSTDPNHPIVSAIFSDVSTASNGLTKVGNDFQLGGVLTKNDTLITSEGKYLNIMGTGDYAVNKAMLKVTSNGSLNGISGYSNGGYGIEGSGSIGVLAYGTYLGARIYADADADALEVTGTGTGLPLNSIKIIENSGVPVNAIFQTTSNNPLDGIGSKVSFMSTYAGSLTDTTNSIISKWDDITNKKTNFQITGKDGSSTNTLLSITGDGKLKLPPYGSGAFTGTPTYNLSVDGEGNVIETAIGGSGEAAWILNGNSVVDSNFIGTLNDKPLKFRVNNSYAGQIPQNTTDNFSLGYLSGGSGSATGIQNIAIGTNSLHSLTIGGQNTSIGRSSQYYVTTGSYNTTIGWAAFGWMNEGDGNTGIGYGAGNTSSSTNTKNYYNTAIGVSALANNFDTRYNIGLGRSAGYGTTNNNTLYISDSTYHMYMQLDSVAGVAPNIISKDENGNWHVYKNSGNAYNDSLYLESPIYSEKELNENNDTIQVVKFKKDSLPEFRYKYSIRDTTNWTDSTLVDRRYVNDRLASIVAGSGLLTDTSGIFTPTVIFSGIVDSTGVPNMRFSRIGNIVTFSGRILLHISGGGQALVFLSLPISPNFTTVNQADGAITGLNTSVSYSSNGIISSSTYYTNSIFLNIRVDPSGADDFNYSFSGQYEIN